MTDDNQKPAVPSYYVCKRVNTHDAVWFVKCNTPRDVEQWKESESGVWMFQITMCFNCNGVPIRSVDHGYYVVYKRAFEGSGWEDDPSLYFEKVTETECISFSALLKLPYHNLFDD
jgi:hypothetical protein